MNLRRRTSRLEVRPLRASDYGSWSRAHASAPKGNRWDHGARPASETTRSEFRKQLAEVAARRRNDSSYSFGVFLRSSGELVGGVSLMDVSRAVFQNAYLGYHIFRRHWRRGYGKEAVGACLDIGFRDLELHRIEAGIEPGNRRSTALARSLGMRREGLKSRALYLGGRWIDISIYTLTCEDLEQRFRGRAAFGATFSPRRARRRSRTRRP